MNNEVILKYNECKDKIEELADKQEELFNECWDVEGMIYFNHEGQMILNPFVSDCCRYRVEPVEFYGDAFISTLPKWFEKIATESKINEQAHN